MVDLTSIMKSNNRESLFLIWLDGSVNRSKTILDVQEQLRTAGNFLKIFENSDECEDYIQSFSKDDRIIFVVNSCLAREIVPRIHDFPQISSIYIYCMNKMRNKQWINKFIKVNITSII